LEYVRLGKAGVKVSRICLGAMTFGREADEATSFRLLDRFVELGGNFVDTANVYSRGGSEEVLGRWFKERGNRQRIVLATKVYGTMGPGPNESGLSRLHIMQSIEDSLRRLQMDYVDLYQIHRWDPNVPVEETLEALTDLVRQGKVRYVGCSNLAAWQLSAFLHAAERRFLARFVSLQPIYNAISRGIESELLPLCEAEGIGVMSYNPLAGGMLTGKYRWGEALPEGARLQSIQQYYDRYFTEEASALVEQFGAAARQRGASPAQLALAWVLGEPRVTCPIVGARNMEQFEDTMGGLELKLSPEEREAVPAALPGRWVGKDPVYDRDR
jgi:aryl-alcohol dehydrogenase-like predicted oxidoreductase